VGEDAGVVYAEMQSRENTQQDLLWNETFKHMYPGDSGYSANVGGATTNIRTSTTLEKVKRKRWMEIL
jgi:Zn-dependent M16 (insulinase) family peptidase